MSASPETVTGIDISGLVVEFTSGGYAVRAIDGLDLRAEAGQIVVLLGPSGCGKTTLLSCLGGILTPTAGRIVVDGVDVTQLTGGQLTSYRRAHVGYVFQAFNLVPSLSARENVAIPLLLSGTPRRTAMDRADHLLSLVHMEGRARAKPGQLSGGQQQRVAIARGLAHDPPVLLADEPTANLDYVQAEGIITLLRELRSDGRLIVIATHDDRLVPIADTVVHLVPDHRADAGPPQQCRVAAQEIVFEQGERAELVYVIEQGEIDIFRRLAAGGEEHLARLGPGQYFGELGPLLGFPRSASARAHTDAQLTAYSSRDFRERILPTIAAS
jgi:putative ABC transport system ATP-binding protein